jgi:uncharacterized protein
MKLLSILPREEKFYHMIDELAAYANTSARLLVTLIKSDNPHEIITAGQEISKSKAEAKKLYELLTAEVCRTFVTPFDREDLQAFADVLYNIPKLIEKIQDRLITHKLRHFNHDFTRMVEIIGLEANALDEVIRILNNGRKIREMHDKSAVLHDLEDRGDHLLGQLIAELFFSIQDTRELILRKDIYEMLEDVTDFYRDCANLALRIILKHS